MDRYSVESRHGGFARGKVDVARGGGGVVRTGTMYLSSRSCEKPR